MTIFSLTTGQASELVRAKPRRPDLTPKQIEWCRQNIPLFAAMQDRAIQSKQEKTDATQ